MTARDTDGRFLNTTEKEIDGKPHKLCSGPGHDDPTWLPATAKYFYMLKYRPGKLSSRCRLCANWGKLKSPGLSGLVPLAVARPFFIEAVNRVGFNEACRRTEISSNAFYRILNGKVYNVRKTTLRKVMLEVISMRRKGEVRHRNSIRRGSHLRGERELQIMTWKDFNNPYDSEADAQRKRTERANMSQEKKDEIRQKDARRKKRAYDAKRRSVLQN